VEAPVRFDQVRTVDEEHLAGRILEGFGARIGVESLEGFAKTGFEHDIGV
jgi:hypothetical protein